jgi:hypothetical protein
VFFAGEGPLFLYKHSKFAVNCSLYLAFVVAKVIPHLQKTQVRDFGKDHPIFFATLTIAGRNSRPLMR